MTLRQTAKRWALALKPGSGGRSNSVDCAALIAEVVRQPMLTLHDRSSAARKLAAAGKPGAEAALGALLGGWTSNAHPKDVIEALGLILQRTAESAPGVLIEMSQRDLPADPQLITVTWSLWNAAVRRRAQSQSTVTIESRLRELASHENEFVRWAAREGFQALNMPPE